MSRAQQGMGAGQCEPVADSAEAMRVRVMVTLVLAEQSAGPMLENLHARGS